MSSAARLDGTDPWKLPALVASLLGAVALGLTWVAAQSFSREAILRKLDQSLDQEDLLPTLGRELTQPGSGALQELFLQRASRRIPETGSFYFRGGRHWFPLVAPALAAVVFAGTSWLGPDLDKERGWSGILAHRVDRVHEEILEGQGEASTLAEESAQRLAGLEQGGALERDKAEKELAHLYAELKILEDKMTSGSSPSKTDPARLSRALSQLELAFRELEETRKSNLGSSDPGDGTGGRASGGAAGPSVTPDPGNTTGSAPLGTSKGTQISSFQIPERFDRIVRQYFRQRKP